MIRATTEHAAEGEDLVDVPCIIFRHKMALLMFNIYRAPLIGGPQVA